MAEWNKYGGLTLICNLLSIVVAYVVGGCIGVWFAPASAGGMLVAIHVPAAMIFLGSILLRVKLNLP